MTSVASPLWWEHWLCPPQAASSSKSSPTTSLDLSQSLAPTVSCPWWHLVNTRHQDGESKYHQLLRVRGNKPRISTLLAGVPAGCSVPTAATPGTRTRAAGLEAPVQMGSWDPDRLSKCPTPHTFLFPCPSSPVAHCGPRHEGPVHLSSVISFCHSPSPPPLSWTDLQPQTHYALLHLQGPVHGSPSSWHTISLSPGELRSSTSPAC